MQLQWQQRSLAFFAFVVSILTISASDMGPMLRIRMFTRTRVGSPVKVRFLKKGILINVFILIDTQQFFASPNVSQAKLQSAVMIS
jgi:hypothetical protein